MTEVHKEMAALEPIVERRREMMRLENEVKRKWRSVFLGLELLSVQISELESLVKSAEEAEDMKDLAQSEILSFREQAGDFWKGHVSIFERTELNLVARAESEAGYGSCSDRKRRSARCYSGSNLSRLLKRKS